MNTIRFDPYNNATSEVSCSFDLRLDETIIVSSTRTLSRKIDLSVSIWKSNTASRYQNPDDLSSNGMTHPFNIHFTTLSSQEVSHAGKHITVVAVVVILLSAAVVIFAIAFGLVYKRRTDRKSRRDHARKETNNDIENDGQGPLYENVQSEAPNYENFRKTSDCDSGNGRMSAAVTMDKDCISPFVKSGTSDTASESACNYLEPNVQAFIEEGSTCNMDEDEYLTPIPLKEEINVISKDEDDYIIPAFTQHDDRDPKDGDNYTLLFPTVSKKANMNANTEEAKHIYDPVIGLY